MKTRVSTGAARVAGLSLILALAGSLGGSGAHAGAGTGARAHVATRLDAPVSPVRAERLFERPAKRWLAGHRGIDLEARAGQDVLSPGSGTVTFAGVVVDRGVVTVAHGAGLVSSVEPVDVNVSVGDVVGAGDVIGVVAEAPGHCTPRACVHWGVRLYGEYINPLDVMHGYGTVRLLPVE